MPTAASGTAADRRRQRGGRAPGRGTAPRPTPGPPVNSDHMRVGSQRRVVKVTDDGAGVARRSLMVHSPNLHRNRLRKSRFQRLAGLTLSHQQRKL